MNTTHAQTGKARKPGTPAFSEQEQYTLDTFNRHVAAFSTANIQDVLADFADDAIVITPDGVFAGRDSIRTIYEGLLAEFGSIAAGDSPGIFIDVLQVRDNTLFITWHAESLHHCFDFGTDTFIIEDGKIRRQSIAFTQPYARVQGGS